MTDPTARPLARRRDRPTRLGPVGRAVRRRPGRRARRPVEVAPTSTGGSPRTTSPARARTPGCCTPPACSTTTTLAGDARRASTGCDADVAVRRLHARPRTTRTCTRRSSAASSSGPAPTSAAGCAPAARATTRWPRCSGCTCASTPASSPAWCSTSSTRWSTRPTRHLGVAMPGPHPPAARPAGAALAPPARPRVGAAARRRPAARLGRARRRLALRLGRAGRAPRSGSTPRPSPPTSASTALGRELDRRHRLAATSSPSSRSSRR